MYKSYLLHDVMYALAPPPRHQHPRCFHYKTASHLLLTVLMLRTKNGLLVVLFRELHKGVLACLRTLRVLIFTRRNTTIEAPSFEVHNEEDEDEDNHGNHDNQDITKHSPDEKV